MSGLLVAIIVVGALAVLAFIGFLVMGLLSDWGERPVRLLLRVAAGLGIVCAFLGALLAFVG